MGALNNMLSAYNPDNVSIPFIGPATVAAGVYSNTTGLDLTDDYTPTDIIRGLLLTPGSGNIGVEFVNGNSFTVDCVVAAGDIRIMTWGLTKTIKKDTTTTYDGYIHPLF